MQKVYILPMFIDRIKRFILLLIINPEIEIGIENVL